MKVKRWKQFKWPSFKPSVAHVKVSQKKLLWGVVGIAVCAALFFWGGLPLMESARKTQEEIALKKKVVLKYEEFIQNQKTVEEQLSRTAAEYDLIQKRLLPGETPQLGAANLQEIVKRLSDKNGIGIRSFKILEPKEIGPYRKISVQIDFSPTNSMLSLGQYMSDIENHEKGLMISEMDVLVLNIRMPNSVQGNLVISGLMKGSKAKPKGREG
jgi:hypothetical protein